MGNKGNTGPGSSREASVRKRDAKVKVKVKVRASSTEGSTELGARFTPEPCRPSPSPPPLGQFQRAFPGRESAATRAVFEGGCLPSGTRTYVLHACINRTSHIPPSVISAQPPPPPPPRRCRGAGAHAMWQQAQIPRRSQRRNSILRKTSMQARRPTGRR
jgi:hypothetical protein